MEFELAPPPDGRLVYFDHDSSEYTATVVQELTERLEKEGASAISASGRAPAR